MFFSYVSLVATGYILLGVGQACARPGLPLAMQLLGAKLQKFVDQIRQL